MCVVIVEIKKLSYVFNFVEFVFKISKNNPSRCKRKKPLLTDYRLAEFLPVFHDTSLNIMDEKRLEEFFEMKQIRSTSLKSIYRKTVNEANLRNFPCHKGGLNVIEGETISPNELPLFLVEKLKNQKPTW